METSTTARILLTGFEPFLHWTVNPSAEVAAVVAAAPPPGIALRARTLPVAFAEARPMLTAEIDSFAPDVVLLLGQGGGPAMRVERVGLNLDDIPGLQDNRGESPEERPIDPRAPAAYFATLPVRPLVRHLRAAGIPAVESFSAGTFLCNHVLFGALHHCARRDRPTQVGFIHLPPLPEQAAERPGREPPASMALTTQVQGVRLALEFLARAGRAGAGLLRDVTGDTTGTESAGRPSRPAVGVRP